MSVFLAHHVPVMAVPVCCVEAHRRELGIPVRSALQADHHPHGHVSKNRDMIKIGDNIL